MPFHGRLHSILKFCSGADNTAFITILSTYFLLTKPHYRDQLRAELQEAFPHPSQALTDDTLAQLPLLDAVITETLRLGTPYFMPRVVPAGGRVLDAHFIPGGTTVAIAAHSQHTAPANFFPDPLVRRVFPL